MNNDEVDIDLEIEELLESDELYSDSDEYEFEETEDYITEEYLDELLGDY